jgi:hypothetical protein
VSAQRPIIVRRKANSGDDRGGDLAVPRKLSIDELGTRAGKLGLSAAIKRFG